jgi:hypothetical protein
MSSDSGRFDDIFNAVKSQEPEPTVEPSGETIAEPATPKASKGGKRSPVKEDKPQEAKPQTKAMDFWNDLEPEAKEATVRLNVDIPISLNDKLAEKARRLRQPKTELVRKLIEWAMNDSSE